MPMNSLLNEYTSNKKFVKKAVPKVSDYREKFREKKLTLTDLPRPVPNPTDTQPDELTGGDWIGEGLQRLI